jgi:uncharacterized protein (TIGR03663 family)
MKLPRYFLVFAIILVAGGLRLPRLGIRPMHADEAIQADKFGTLLETGEYRYDPHNYHGPTLNYLTLPSAWLAGISNYRDLDEMILRRVPAVLGLLLVLVPFLLKGALTFPEAAACAALTAISPAMSFFSRYYIHEMLLTFFAAGFITCGFLYFNRPRLAWAAAGGVSAGLMLATKETAFISIGSLSAALILAILFRGRQPHAVWPLMRTDASSISLHSDYPRALVLFRHGMSFLLMTLGVVVMLFSSFLKHPAGLKDFLTAYSIYFQRSGHDSFHIHPWHYYLDLLLFFKEAPGLFWSEAFIVALAALGGWSILRDREGNPHKAFLLRILLFYTVLMTLAYAAIPYKTPWCLIGFLHAMILIAGAGLASLLKFLSRTRLAWLASMILIAGAIHLFCQSLLANFKYYDNPSNPYVYAHTSSDVFTIMDKLDELAKTSHEGHNLAIQIYSRTNLWPLPWYLRNFQRVEWWTEVPDKIPIAPVVLATPEMEAALVRKLYELPPPGQRELYLRLFSRYVELRPSVEVRGFIAKSFWERVRNAGAF